MEVGCLAIFGGEAVAEVEGWAAGGVVVGEDVAEEGIV